MRDRGRHALSIRFIRRKEVHYRIASWSGHALVRAHLLRGGWVVTLARTDFHFRQGNFYVDLAERLAWVRVGIGNITKNILCGDFASYICNRVEDRVRQRRGKPARAHLEREVPFVGRCRGEALHVLVYVLKRILHPATRLLG